MNVSPLYIIGGHEPWQCDSYRLFSDLKPQVVVAHDDLFTSRRLPPAQVLKMPKPPPGQGGAVLARNFAVAHAEAQGHTHLWIADDDIHKVFDSVSGRWVAGNPTTILTKAQDIFFNQPWAACISLTRFDSYAQPSIANHVRNADCDILHCLNISRLGACRFRQEFFPRERTDFALQLLTSGWASMRLHNLAFSTQRPLLAQPLDYFTPLQATASRRLQTEWSESLVRRDGNRLVVAWENFPS